MKIVEIRDKLEIIIKNLENFENLVEKKLTRKL